MRSDRSRHILPGIAMICILLAACVGLQPQPTAIPAKPTAVPSGKITQSGFNCPQPNPRLPVSSTELNLYVWSQYVPADFIECFELVYGVKVNSSEYDSDEAMYAGLTGSGSAYDLIQPTDFVVPRLVREDLLRPLDHSQLPVLANFNPHYMNLGFDPENLYTIPYEAGVDGIVFNSATVPNPPKSWADLWNQEYQGRIVVADDERALIGVTLLTLGYDVNATGASQLDQARRALQVLAPGIKAYDSDSPHSRLVSGEVDLGETWNGEAFLANQQVPSIKFVYPSEGAILWQDNWAIPKSAPHPDAAYAWLNYTNQGDMFWMMLTNFPYTNPNEAALNYATDSPMEVTDVNGNPTTLGQVYKTFMNSTITNPPVSVIQAGHRISDVGDATALYDQIWAEIRGSQ
jgi:spermidine/putrescine-binding protein